MEDNPKDVNKHHTFGWAPLHVAAANNKYKHVEVLLKHGADPNISEGFSNFYHVAQKVKVNPADGNYTLLYNICVVCILI